MNKQLVLLEKVLREAGEKLLAQKVVVSKHKTKNDLLTENDVAIENFIVDKLKKLDPTAEILSEENYSDGNLTGRCYVIDPIDGTCNFAANLPHFGIQVAYFENGECIASILYFPKTGDVLTAALGEGTHLNGKLIRVDSNADSSDGFLIISDYYDEINIPMHKQFALVQSLQSHFLKTRHFGAACVDFSLLACGNALTYVCYYSKIWDIAPGLLIAKEAGCVYSSLDGSSYKYGNAGLVVANNEHNLNIVLNEFIKL